MTAMTSHKMWAAAATALAVGVGRIVVDATPMVAADLALVVEPLRMFFEAALIAFVTWAIPNRPKDGGGAA